MRDEDESADHFVQPDKMVKVRCFNFFLVSRSHAPAWERIPELNNGQKPL